MLYTMIIFVILFTKTKMVMKKIYLSLLFVVSISFSIMAQIIVDENFDTLNTGQGIALQFGAPWTTWSNAPGSAEDANVSSDFAFSGSNSLKIVTNNDCVLDFGDKTSGRFLVTFKMYVVSGNVGYFNFLSTFAGSSSEWATQVYFNTNGSGSIDADGANSGTFTFSHDTWMTMNFIFDLDDDFATFYLDGTEVKSWKYSNGTFGTGELKLDAMNIFGWNGTGTQTSLFYVDDIHAEQLSGVPGDPPTNLLATGNGSDMDLTWDVPAGSPDAYAISRNGSVLLSNHPTNSYTDTGLYPANFNYLTRARYGQLGYSHASNEVQGTVASTGKKCLFEEFTTEACQYCPAATLVIEDFLSTGVDAVMVAHHAGFGTDFMTTSEDTELLEMYNESTYAPAGMVDRFYNGLDNDGDGTPEPGPVYHAARIPTTAPARLAMAPEVTVDINGVYDMALNKMEVTVSGEFLTDVTASDLRVVVYITENNIPSVSQAGATSAWVHQHVFRDAISGTYGDAGIITASTTGSTYSGTFNYTWNPSWVTSELNIVAFVANYNAGNVNDRTVINANEVQLTNFIVSNENITLENEIGVYPNPTHNYIRVTNADNAVVEVFNMLGEKVLTNTVVDRLGIVNLISLENGTYFVKIHANNQVVTKTIVLTK